jgi:hypothetical protein
MRGLSVRGKSSLVLVRATDTPFYADQSSARIQSSSLSSMLSLVATGLKKVQLMVEKLDGVALPRISQATETGTRNDTDQ